MHLKVCSSLQRIVLNNLKASYYILPTIRCYTLDCLHNKKQSNNFTIMFV